MTYIGLDEVKRPVNQSKKQHTASSQRRQSITFLVIEARRNPVLK